MAVTPHSTVSSHREHGGVRGGGGLPLLRPNRGLNRPRRRRGLEEMPAIRCKGNQAPPLTPV